MKHILSVLVENKPGVLSRVTGMVSRRGFNIDSLSVGPTEDPTMSLQPHHRGHGRRVDAQGHGGPVPRLRHQGDHTHRQDRHVACLQGIVGAMASRSTLWQRRLRMWAMP